LDDDGAVHSRDVADIASTREAKWRWVDVIRGSETVLDELAREFGLHPLLVEDALHRQHRPKLDTFADGAFLAWLTPVRCVGDGIESLELDVFIGPEYLITVREDHSEAISDVVAEAERVMALGPDWLLHAIIDRLVDSVLPIADGLGDDLDDVEDALLGAPKPENLRSLYTIRRQLVQLHRIVAPERDILRGLARERGIVGEEAYRYFQDVADHLARVEDSIETYRDVGAAAMDIYLSAQSNRMNEIMKQLTVVATIVMPLTLISGIYGMNVIRCMWPPVSAVWSFWAVVVSMVAIAIGMALYFRRKNWW
jgi:magnesium transporter